MRKKEQGVVEAAGGVETGYIFCRAHLTAISGCQECDRRGQGGREGEGEDAAIRNRVGV